MDENKEKSSFWEIVRYLLIAVVIVLPFRIFIAQPYIVSGSSMIPTFENGDYLIVDQISKRFKEIDRESVVIIKYPKNTSKFFIKRLIGFPNEKIEIKNGTVFIFNKENPDGLELKDNYIKFKKDENFYIELKDDEYFVMGDNRMGSSDSRIWGTLPKKYIIGEPILRLLPVKNLETYPGQIN